MAEEDNRLDVYLAKSTNPLNDNIDEELLTGLCAAINDRPDGPQVALRYLAHKIQSPQEIEALHSLNLLAKLITVCGHRLTDEIGKFRFLNEVIKVVSPKYLAHRTPPKVKQRVVELMFLWSLELKEMPKIFEAYQMLKKQQIVSEDPTYIIPNYKPPTPPLPRPKDEIFDDEKNAELLQKLLKSGKPGDLEAANQLIKLMAKESDKRMDLKSRFESEIEIVYNNANVLSDMLSFYSPNDSSVEEKDLMKELFESCEKLRIRLFKLANELSDDDPNMTRLFNANDELTKAINAYKQMLGIVSTDDSKNLMTKSNQINLLDIPSSTTTTTTNKTSIIDNILNDVELLDDHFISLSSKNNNKCNTNTLNDLQELRDIFSVKNNNELSSTNHSILNDVLLPQPIAPSNSTNIVSDCDKRRKSGQKLAFDELDHLSQSLLKSNLLSDEFKYKNKEPSKSLNELQRIQSNARNINDNKECDKNMINGSVMPLTDINVSLDSIKPSDTKPITLYDKNKVQVILYLASNSPRSDVNVFVITIISTNSSPVSKINFLAAVPKSMRVKLQAMFPSNSLPAFQAFISPTLITQVMLIARDVHKQEKVRLKYKLSYNIDNENHNEIGEIDSLLDNYGKS
ncbi:ADP-ribosylation factor-binding protein GGA3-like [Oppia nitens]|uniref:ADP-ribosylation factor-binding protein GGA3-like n=1 Tax=Oppia nitens TaxID=1686743 RepID=UPI0023DB9297|nr:ADP-ribosylation factor-binding protein GGA3-like [Oppia nitens]